MRARSLTPTVLLTLGVLAGGLVFSSAPAMAVEMPETVSPATGITATSAVLHGVLNPGNTGEAEAGSYDFSYQPASSLAPECGMPGTLVPSSPVADTGAQGEAKTLTLTGLEANKEYAFCIVAYSLAGGLAEPSYGAAVPFTTLPAPPTLAIEKTNAVSSTTATLEAELNANNESTTYTFEYSTTESGGALTGTPVKLKDENPLEGGNIQTVTVPRIEGLQPSKTYYYRVVAENAKSKEEVKPVEGAVQSFTTVATPTTKPVTAITATTAMFHGELKPLSGLVEAEFSFDYGVGAENCAGGSATPVEGAGLGAGATAVVSAPVGGLEPNATYSVCLVSLDKFGAAEIGSEVDPHTPQVQFPTPPAPPQIEEQFADNLTPFSVILNAFINPDNEKTTWAWEYANEKAKLGTPAATVVKGESPFEPSYSSEYARLETGNILTPDTIYYYRVIAENEQSQIEGKPAQGTPQSFKTEPAVAPTIEPGSEHATNLRSQSATLEANINDDDQETTVVFEYGTTTSYGTKVTAHAGESDAIAEGLIPATNYYMRVTATNPSGTTHSGAPVTFETPPAPHVEETLPEAIEITPRTAVITNITINPQFEEPGEEPSYYITYGETEAYGQALPAPTHEKAGYGHTGHRVPAVELYGLRPATTYHYAIIAHNPNGTTSSTDRQFTTAPAPPLTTPPAIGNSSAQFTSENSTVIEGEVNPEGQTTSYHVEYDTTTSYGTSTSAALLAASTTPQGTITAITGLAPGTTYHYRIAATNAAGTGYGPDATFATGGATRTGTFTSFTVPTVPQIAVTPFKFPAETANTQSPSIEVVSHKVKGKTATIVVSVPAAGKLAVSGKGLSSSSKKASGRETLTFRLNQKQAGKLTTKIKLTFTPSGKGKKQSKTLSVKFEK